MLRQIVKWIVWSKRIQTIQKDRQINTDRYTNGFCVDRQTDRQRGRYEFRDISKCHSLLKKGLKYLFCLSVCLSIYLSVCLSVCLSLNVILFFLAMKWSLKIKKWKPTTIHSSTLAAPGWCEVHLFPVEKLSHLNHPPPPLPRPIRARTYLMGLQRKLCAKPSQIETSRWNNT